MVRAHSFLSLGALARILLAWLAVAGGAQIGTAQGTDIYFDITSNTTWTTAGSPYRVHASIAVLQGATLTIQAGVEVLFDNNRSLLVGSTSAGALQASGTVASPVVFRRNGSPLAGAWIGLRFLSGTFNSSLVHCEIRDAGQTGQSIICFSGTGPLLQDISISNAAATSIGVTVQSSAPTFAGTMVFSGSSGFAIDAINSSVSPQFSAGFSLSTGGLLGRGPLAMWSSFFGASPKVSGTRLVAEIYGGTLSQSADWGGVQGLHLHVIGNLVISRTTGNTPVLKLRPGTLLKLDPNAHVQVGTAAGAPGGLIADGTAVQPVILTSTNPTQSSARWGNIVFNPAATSGSRLTNCTLRNGGAIVGAVFCQTNSPTFTNLTIEDCTLKGLYVSNAAPILDSVTFRRIGEHAIYVPGTTNVPTISGTWSFETVGALGYGAPAFWQRLFAATVLAPGGPYSQEVINGILSLSTTWGAPNASPIRLLGTLDVYGPSTPVLSITAGTSFEIAQGAAIRIGTTTGQSGGIIASGAPGAKVVFKPQAGQRWDAIYLNPYSTPSSRLEQCDLQSCGQPGLAGIVIQGSAAPAVASVSVDDPTATGDAFVLNSSSAPRFSGSLSLSNSTGTLIRANTTTAHPAFSGVSVSSTGKIAIGGARLWTDFFDSNPAIVVGSTGDVYGDTVSWNATWGATGVALHVLGDLFVRGATAPRLAIVPGTIVRMDAGKCIRVGTVTDQGGFWAIGTASDPIRFEKAQAGEWGKVQINNCPIAGQVTLEHCQFLGSGALEFADPQCAILVRNGSPILRDLAIVSSVGDGIYVEDSGQATIGSALTFAGSSSHYLLDTQSVAAQVLCTSQSPAVLTSNTKVARMSADSWSSYFAAGSSITGGPYDAEVLPGSVSGVVSWGGVSGLSIRLLGDLRMDRSSTLTILPGTQVKLDSDASIDVRAADGSLQAVGTAVAPIQFVSTSGATWGEIGCYGGSMRLEHCTLDGGGAATVGNIVFCGTPNCTLQDIQITGSDSAGIVLSSGTLTAVTVANCQGDGVRVTSGSPSLSQVVISGCSAEGLDVTSSNPVINGLTVSGCQSDGLRLSLSSPQLNGVNISGCAGYAIQAFDTVSEPTFSSITLTPVAGKLGRGSANLWGRLFNASPTIVGTGLTQEVFPSTLTINTTWSSLSGALIIRLLGDLRIDGSSAKLTLSPGTTMRIDPTFSVLVGTAGGAGGAALDAAGTSTEPVRFERAGGAAWGRIGFGAQASGALSRLSDCQIADGGNSIAAVDVTSTTPLIQSVAISNSASDGIRIQSSSPTLASVSVTGAVGNGLALTSSNASVSGVTISGCGGDGVRLTASSPSLTGLDVSTATGYAIQALDATSTPTFSSVTLAPVAGKLGRGGANFWDRLYDSSPTLSGSGLIQEVIASTLASDTTWGSSSGNVLVRIVGDLKIDGAASRLTLVPGSVVRLDPGIGILVGTVAGPSGATLIAAGTASAPVRFERAATGRWGSLAFGAQANGTASRLSDCQIVDGGNLTAAVEVTTCNPTIERCTISGSGSDGVRITGTTLNLTAITVTNSVAAGVRSITANSTLTRSTLQGNQVGLRMEGATGNVSAYNNVIIANTIAALQNAASSAASARLNWWGSDTGPAPGSITGDVSYEPWLGAATLGPISWLDAQQAPNPFNQVAGSTFFTGSFDQSANWTISILNGATTVRTLTGSGSTFNQEWSGEDNNTNDLPDGSYTYHLDASNGAGNATQAIGLATLDSSYPAARITSPTPNELLLGTVPVIGTATATPLTQWVLEFGAGTSPTSYTTINSGTNSIINGMLGSWNTSSLQEFLYTLRLRVTSGSIAESDQLTVRLFKILNVTATETPIDPYAAGQSATIDYVLGGPADVLARVYSSSSHALVRQIAAPGQAEGPNQITWDCRDGNGQVPLPLSEPSEAYYFTLEATNQVVGVARYNNAGSPIMAPVPANNLNNSAQVPGAADWPYRNDVARVTFSLTGRGRFTVRATTTDFGGGVGNTLNLLVYDRINLVTTQQSLTWNGRLFDNSIVSIPFSFWFDVPKALPENAIVLERQQNSFDSFRAQPYVFHPLYGQVCTFEYSLVADAYVDIDIFDPNGTQCRSLLAGAAQTAGSHTAIWNGRDDAGRLVSSAGSTYSIRIRATEAATGRLSTDWKTVTVYR